MDSTTENTLEPALSAPRRNSPSQHSLGKSIALHLFPGVLLLFFYVCGARWGSGLGIPTLLVLYSGMVLIAIPVQLGYMLHQGKIETGRFTLEGIVVYRQPMPWWRYMVIIVPLLLWGVVLVAFVFKPLNSFVFSHAFSWLPKWFYLQPGSPEVYSRTTLLCFWIIYAIANLSGALVEELYFRGYLLPRLSRFGFWAPVLNTVLFSLYHFFTPEENLGRILALLPMVW